MKQARPDPSAPARNKNDIVMRANAAIHVFRTPAPTRGPAFPADARGFDAPWDILRRAGARGPAGMTEPTTPLWEVFIRSRNGLAHKHVGSIHAADAEMALQAARDTYTRRNEGLSLWVVPSAAIVASDPAEKGMLFEPAVGKVTGIRRSMRCRTKSGICKSSSADIRERRHRRVGNRPRRIERAVHA